MENVYITVLLSAFASFLGGLVYLIYNNLNKKASDNSSDIKEVRNMYATKDELKELKRDIAQTREEDRERFKRIEDKMDRILELLMEKKHEN